MKRSIVAGFFLTCFFVATLATNVLAQTAPKYTVIMGSTFSFQPITEYGVSIEDFVLNQQEVPFDVEVDESGSVRVQDFQQAGTFDFAYTAKLEGQNINGTFVIEVLPRQWSSKTLLPYLGSK